MTDDLLKEATRALQDETADDAADGRFTRARVMASLHQGKVKRRTRLAFVLPIAACLAAGTAWGAATGRLPAVFHAVGQFVGYSSQTSESKPAQHAAPVTKKPAPVAEAQVPPPPAELPAEPVPVVDTKPEPTKVEPQASAKPAISGGGAGSSAAFQDADGDLYRLAHEAHFVNHDYARALSGWNAYLQAAPGGRLATEARYNRAICLLRLGRDAEARQALEPFASGKFGGYRQNEARELLEELSR
jgi:TolA-binding protein